MKMRKIENPYQTAFTIPFFLFADRFVKNETVSGINGKMQGKSKDNKPAPAPIKKSRHKLWLTVSSPQEFVGWLISIVEIKILDAEVIPPSNETENEKEVPG